MASDKSAIDERRVSKSTIDQGILYMSDLPEHCFEVGCLACSDVADGCSNNGTPVSRDKTGHPEQSCIHRFYIKASVCLRHQSTNLTAVPVPPSDSPFRAFSMPVGRLPSLPQG